MIPLPEPFHGFYGVPMYSADQLRACCDDEGYWCVVCGRFLPSDEGVIVHDDVPHPSDMTFDDEETPQ